MKKVASLVAAALITCSLGACGNRNTAYYRTNNQPPVNTSQDIRNKASAPNIGGNIGVTTTYRDGVYLGNGNNRGATGNEAAIVTIKGGRISDVTLKSMDAQGRDITHYSNTTVNTPAGVTNKTGTTGRTTGTTTSDTVTMDGTYNGAYIGDNTNINRNVGTNTNTNTTASALEIARRDLANAIVTNQTANVNITTTQTGAINNWKLAVTRALEVLEDR